MNKANLGKMAGKRVCIRPKARRVDPILGELPPLEDHWVVISATQKEMQLENPRSGHRLCIGTDHIREFRTDPNGSDGLLILKSQVILRGNGIDVEPLT